MRKFKTNQLQTTPGRVDEIFKTMSFEEAATLAVVCIMTNMHSHFDFGSPSVDKTVFIHSAAGGDIAAIQLAKFISTEVSAPAGSFAKTQFLKLNFGTSERGLYAQLAQRRHWQTDHAYHQLSWR